MELSIYISIFSTLLAMISFLYTLISNKDKFILTSNERKNLLVLKPRKYMSYMKRITYIDIKLGEDNYNPYNDFIGTSKPWNFEFYPGELTSKVKDKNNRRRADQT